MIRQEDESDMDEEISPEDIRTNVLVKAEEEDDDDEVLPTTANVKTSNRLLLANEEEDEYDEPLEQRELSNILLARDASSMDVVPVPSQPVGVTHQADTIPSGKVSEECAEAEASITADPWDISSWHIYIHEIEEGRGRSEITPVQAYKKMLTYFPRAYKVWKAFAEYLIKQNDVDQAESTFAQGCDVCWSVELWHNYILFLLDQYAILRTQHHKSKLESVQNMLEAYKTKCLGVFEVATDRVGMMLDSMCIWRAYIDFITATGADTSHTSAMTGGAEAIELTKKLALLRKVYQKVCILSIDGSDLVWKEYEAFEKSRVGNVNPANPVVGEGLMVVAEGGELHKQHLHARSLLRERKRYLQNLVVDRYATPPSSSPSEAAQLEQWGAWLAFEGAFGGGGPDYLHPEHAPLMVRLVFQLCLSNYSYHPEVYISYAKYEAARRATGSSNGTSTSGSTSTTTGAEGLASARDILQQGLKVLPTSTLLHISLAELEEQFGQAERAGHVYRALFQSLPSALSFSLLQRFVRRNVSVAAARRLFSETAAMRIGNDKLAMELYLAHATLELELNTQPQVCLKILDCAGRGLGVHNCFAHPPFVRLYVRACVRAGEVLKLRYAEQLTIDAVVSEFLGDVDGGEGGGGAVGGRVAALLNLLTPPTAAPSFAPSYRRAPPIPEAAYRKLSPVLDLFVKAEGALGVGANHHGNQPQIETLRSVRMKVRMHVYDDSSRGDGEAPGTSSGGRGRGSRSWGLLEIPAEVLERCDPTSSLPLPLPELELRDRVLRAKGLAAGKDGAAGSSANSGGAGAGAGASARRERQGQLSQAEHVSLAGLPLLLRDFLLRLPQISNNAASSSGGMVQAGEVDAFVRHMRGVTLPPRPAADHDDQPDDSHAGKARTGEDWSSVQGGGWDVEDVGEESAGDWSRRLYEEREEDVYRARQRQRVA